MVTVIYRSWNSNLKPGGILVGRYDLRVFSSGATLFAGALRELTLKRKRPSQTGCDKGCRPAQELVPNEVSKISKSAHIGVLRRIKISEPGPREVQCEQIAMSKRSTLKGSINILFGATQAMCKDLAPILIEPRRGDVRVMCFLSPRKTNPASSSISWV
jgi:hypothetical protein